MLCRLPRATSDSPSAVDTYAAALAGCAGGERWEASLCCTSNAPVLHPGGFQSLNVSGGQQ